MTRSATVSLSCASALAALLVPGAAAAQKVVTDESVSAVEVAKTPLEDLNIEKDPIPPALLRARAGIYANAGLDHCAELRNEIGDLDAVLGEDFDTGGPERGDPMEAGRLAQKVVAMLIPFRGVIREVTGANRHAADFQEAIAAGMIRRAYLKGLGEATGCPYPARPAPPEVIAATILPRGAPPKDDETEDEEGTSGREVQVD